ncbi:MAG: ATP-binding protein, partial [Chthoniobacterales bacterium]
MSTAPEQLVNAQHPWIGLASFTENEREFFAGRGEEVDELLRLVRRDIHTLLYGVSGLGKTSLLQAGIFPAVRAENWLPVPIRLDYLESALPLATQVISAITGAAQAAGVELPQHHPGETLWEYFHHEGNHFWSARNDLTTPFLVFDQFEEAFTIGSATPARSRRISEFIIEFADLVENRPPAALRDDPERARQFSFKPASFRVLLAMREDYLAELDRLRSQFRALGQNRLRLLPMGARQARQVIDLGASLLAPGVADRIVTFVAGGAAAAEDG